MTIGPRLSGPATKRRIAPAAAQWAAGLLFAATLCATLGLLWFAHRLAPPDKALAVVAILSLLWAVGALLQPRARALAAA